MKSIVIIVTYNRKELLKESIEALINQTNKNFDLLIVDNASTDNTYNDIVSKYESDKIKYINTQKNLGGAGGFNFGLKRAILDGYSKEEQRIYGFLSEFLLNVWISKNKLKINYLDMTIINESKFKNFIKNLKITGRVILRKIRG